jgi:hypothetical protein
VAGTSLFLAGALSQIIGDDFVSSHEENSVGIIAQNWVPRR